MCVVATVCIGVFCVCGSYSVYMEVSVCGSYCVYWGFCVRGIGCILGFMFVVGDVATLRCNDLRGSLTPSYATVQRFLRLFLALLFATCLLFCPAYKWLGQAADGI